MTMKDALREITRRCPPPAGGKWMAAQGMDLFSCDPGEPLWHQRSLTLHSAPVNYSHVRLAGGQTDFAPRVVPWQVVVDLAIADYERAARGPSLLASYLATDAKRAA